MKVVAFDTETTGIPLRPKLGEAPIYSDDPRQPRILQFAGVRYEDGKEVFRMDNLVKPDGWDMPPAIIEFNEKHNTGITMERLHAEGRPILSIIEEFRQMIADADVIVAHNNSFDIKMFRIELSKNGLKGEVADLWRDDNRHFCTMRESTVLCKLPAKNLRFGPYKAPKLTEAYEHFFQRPMGGEHQGINDALACAEIYFKLVELMGGKPTPKAQPINLEPTATIGF